MNKLRRLLPLLVFTLILVCFLWPSRNSTVSQDLKPASAPAGTADTLSLVNTSPASAPASATETASKKTKSGSGKNQSEESQSGRPAATPAGTADDGEGKEELLPEDGSYTTKEDVSLYLIQYGHLPSNFITKKEARKAGWQGGALEKLLPGMCIGGDYFGNYEGQLPSAKGRRWTECDINTLGARSRGAERLIFSNDGLIYYTGDHYNTFTQLY